MYLLKKVFDLREKAHSDHEKPFLEHLEDLRVMVTKVTITLVVSMIICFTFQGELMSVLRAPAEKVLLTKQKQTMPDAEKYQGIKAPTVEIWNRAKLVEQGVAGLDDEQREIFYLKLGEPEMEFHASSVALLRAAKVLPKEKRIGFVKGLKVDEAMTQQLLALVDSDPDVEPGAGSNIRMMSALKPTETFMLSMKLAFFAGIVLAFPFLLMFILQFVLPGLHSNERRVLWPAMAVGFGLFICGVLFAYFFVLPRALLFFYEWSGGLGVSNDWRIGEYITFAIQFTLLFGLSFELPVVVMVLVKLGLLNYEMMARTRTYAVVAIYITAAIITPTPDIMTLNLMAVPMLILYEICIWLAWFDRKKAREEEAREEEELKRHREKWLLQNNDPEADGESVEEPGDDGFHDDYHHGDYYDPHRGMGEGDDDPYHHDSYDEDHAHYRHGLPGDEEWSKPEDAVTDHGSEKSDEKESTPDEDPKPDVDDDNKKS